VPKIIGDQLRSDAAAQEVMPYKTLDARRRRSSADARPVSSSRDARLAKTTPGRNARFAGMKNQLK